jgi:hypothetical protein
VIYNYIFSKIAYFHSHQESEVESKVNELNERKAVVQSELNSIKDKVYL